MIFTLGNWVFLGVMTVVLLGVGVFITWGNAWGDKKDWIIGILITVLSTAIIILCIGFGIRWYNTSTASGVRAVKDWQSEVNNGINREILITAEDGREIFHYEGKVDIESNHTDNYIKFESEDGKRYIIYYGIQDTIQIIEK